MHHARPRAAAHLVSEPVVAVLAKTASNPRVTWGIHLKGGGVRDNLAFRVTQGDSHVEVHKDPPVEQSVEDMFRDSRRAPRENWMLLVALTAVTLAFACIQESMQQDEGLRVVLRQGG